jgi:sortase A
MPKITENDLKDLFEKNDGEPVRVVKSLKQFDHIGSVRKKIENIKDGKTKVKTKGFNFGVFILRTLFFWGVIGFIALITLGAPALFDRLKWTYYVDYLNQKLPKSEEAIPEKTKVAEDKIVLPKELPQFDNIDNNLLVISKISVKAPVIWDTPEDDLLGKLEEGVVHYQGTSHPGEGGNIFLVGHSSNYFWISSDYSTVFALLDKMENGDRVEISYKNKKYFYGIKDKRVVNSDQVEVLQNTAKETLTLMTCWPVGTSLNRLIVQADLIYSSY